MKTKSPKEKISELREAALPLIKYLNENHNPHAKAIVTSASVELLEGIMSDPKIYDFIQD